MDSQSESILVNGRWPERCFNGVGSSARKGRNLRQRQRLQGGITSSHCVGHNASTHDNSWLNRKTRRMRAATVTNSARTREAIMYDQRTRHDGAAAWRGGSTRRAGGRCDLQRCQCTQRQQHDQLTSASLAVNIHLSLIHI